MFKCDELVYARPRIVDKPILATYIREISEEEIKAGYRPGHLVKIDGIEKWVRKDLCAEKPEYIINL